MAGIKWADSTSTAKNCDVGGVKRRGSTEPRSRLNMTGDAVND